MKEAPILPLRYPLTWPPPDLPAYTNYWFERIPIIGHVARYIRWLCRMKQHQREILDPIANQIILQLNVRPPVGRWPDTSEKRQIAKIISQAICAKKGLTHPRALHPEDPFPFLFWGTDDDLTPALVRIELGKQFHFDLPSDVILRAWNERWTLQTFINCCDHHRQSHAEG